MNISALDAVLHYLGGEGEASKKGVNPELDAEIRGYQGGDAAERFFIGGQSSSECEHEDVPEEAAAHAASGPASGDHEDVPEEAAVHAASASASGGSQPTQMTSEGVAPEQPIFIEVFWAGNGERAAI